VLLVFFNSAYFNFLWKKTIFVCTNYPLFKTDLLISITISTVYTSNVMSVKIITTTVLLVFLMHINASKYIFRSISTEKGLSCTQVHTILQDKKGFMWVGTTDGLNRYDGFNFKNYLPDPKNPKSIQGNNIYALNEDINGLIWIYFSSGEISYYNPVLETFTNYSTQYLKELLPKYTKATSFYKGIGSKIFIGTDGGLLLFDSNTNNLLQIKNTPSIVSFSYIYDICKGTQNTLWIATSEGYSNFNQNNFVDYNLRSKDPIAIRCLFLDASRNLWLGTNNVGLYKVKVSDLKKMVVENIPLNGLRIFKILEGQVGEIWVGHNKGVTKLAKINNHYQMQDSYFNSKKFYYPSIDLQLTEMQKDQTGNIWFGDLRLENGVYYYSKSTDQIEVIKSDSRDPHTLQQYGITTMYIDKSNNLWIGHNNAGLSVSNLNKSPFNLSARKSNDSQLSSNHIHSLCEDHNQNLWIGTDKGINVIDGISGKLLKNYYYGAPSKAQSLSGRIPGSIVEDRNFKIWVGYLGSNPDLIDPVKNTIQPFPYNELITNSAFIWRTISMVVDNNNTAWFTTGGAGLAKYNNDGATFTYYTPGFVKNSSISPICLKNNHISDYSLYSICKDKNDNLWIGTDVGGLNYFDTKTEKFTNFFHSENDKYSLSSNFVRYVYCDSNDEIWVGTNVGLNKLIKKTKSFKQYTIQDGLVGNTIQGIIEAEKGILYISTNNGISRFDSKKESFTNYTIKNGLLSNEYSTGACLKRKSGELVFGSINNGVLSFFPDKLLLSNIKPNVLISEVKIRNKALKIGKNEILEKSILYTKEIEIPFSESKDISIEFLSLNHALPESNSYRYKLDGFDKEWKETDFTQRLAVYNQLNPGKYNFIVSASNDGKNWCESATLKITILPPWWETWWFISLLGLSIVAFIYLLYKRRIKEYKLRHQQLEKQVEDRTSKLNVAKVEVEIKNIELKDINEKLAQQNIEIQDISNQLNELNEIKTDFFTNISHELRTPLSIIKGLTESVSDKLVKKDTVKFKEPLDIIQKNILLLIRQVNQLLNISLLDKGKLQPKISENNLNLFLEEIAQTFSFVSEQYQVSFSTYISENIKLGYFDLEIIEQTIFNLLSNALKYTPNGGSIFFSAHVTQKESINYVNISIEDSGIGIKEDELVKIFDRFYRNDRKQFQRFESSGIGLAYCKEIITRHLGDISCKSEYEKGSIFKISFAISKEAYPLEWISQSNFKSISSIDYIKELAVSKSNKNSISPELVENEHPLLLVVEDNKDLCSYLFELLSDNYRIEIAYNGKEGLYKARELHPDAIISDIMMPIMTGLEMCREIKLNELTSHIPVMLLTARTNEQQQLEGFETGADDYVVKPFNADILLAKIKSLVQQKNRIKKYYADTFDIEQPGNDLPEDEKIFFEKATKVVLDNLQDIDFDVDKFCSLMFMSRTNLFRKLKSVTGQSATSFTKTIRLKQAAILLKNPTFSINEVASMVGFSDPNYFARCFKDLFNVTPSNY